jgi:hypothetical protein
VFSKIAITRKLHKLPEAVHERFVKVFEEFLKIDEFQLQPDQNNKFKNVKNNASNQTYKARMKEPRYHDR